MRLNVLFVVCILVSAVAVQAQEQKSGSGKIDKATIAALAQTMQMLQTPDKRNEVIAKDPAAKQVDDRVRSLAGTEENQEAIYEFAAEVFQGLLEETNGNVELAMKKLEEMKNPEVFAARLTPSQKTKLQKLSERMPASKK
jgi:hypothetical protein